MSRLGGRALAVLGGSVLFGCGDPDAESGDTDLGQVEPEPSLLALRAPAGALKAGAAWRSIVPSCFEDWNDANGNFIYRRSDGDTFNDCGCDRLCPGDEGYPGPDEGEGDGEFQAIWIGGFANGRAAMGVRGAEHGRLGEGDGLEARALVVERDELRIGIVTLDALGLMYDDTLRIRQMADERGLELDHVIVHSSHSHSAPDTMGIYGPSITQTGYDERYAGEIREASIEALAEAVDGLTPVSMRYGQVSADDYWDNGSANLIRDSRDPFIVDPRIGAVQFVGEAGTVGTLVQWANHPETIGGSNALMSSGFVHATRQVVSTGSEDFWDTDPGRLGVGGVTVFLNGAVGGMMTSLGAKVLDPDGIVHDREDRWLKTDVIGALVGELALDALAGGEVVEEVELAIGADAFRLPVDNTAFKAMFQVGNFDHRTAYGLADFDDDDAEIDSEMNILQIGPLRIVTWPGEVLPEVVLGGKDGAFTPQGVPLVRPDNPHPPDVSLMPDGPYLLEQTGGELNWILGLGNDEVGYIIPTWQFKVDEAVPYLQQAPGDHYEETNSLGPETSPILEARHAALVGWLNGEGWALSD